MSSPTQRSLALYRERGMTAAVVERWCAFTRRRHDLFGIGDLLAIGDGITVLCQTTSASNFAARVKKISDSEHLPAIRRAGWEIHVHGWRKNARGRWEVRELVL